MHEKYGKKRAGPQSPLPGGGGGLEKGLKAPHPQVNFPEVQWSLTSGTKLWNE